MSMSHQAGFLTTSHYPLLAPDAPTIGTATGLDAQATVTFTAPANTGAGAITGYVAVASTGQFASGSTSPITVSGLTNGVAVTLRVYAVSDYGISAFSSPSNSTTPGVVGQQAYTTPGTYSWVAPSGVGSVSVFAVGGGGGGGAYTNASSIGGTGGGGGASAYSNNISVTPGNSYTVVVGAGGTGGVANSGNNAGVGGTSSFTASVTVTAAGGAKGTQSGYTGVGYKAQGGMGAAGYGGVATTTSATAGTNGGGGSGEDYTSSSGAGGGGGVGLLGQGANGVAGGSGTAGAGGGGSGGSNGGVYGSNPAGAGGNYGGGGGASMTNGSTAGAGARGAVRIIWPGSGRSFPSTNTGDL
jgi:hypothetical protein